MPGLQIFKSIIKPSTYRVHSLEKYSIFSTSTAIDQKTRSVHIYGHLNTYILLFDYRTLHAPCLHFTVDIQSGRV